jgi:two-component system, OmpR family, KDP operon response regulator KdpE
VSEAPPLVIVVEDEQQIRRFLRTALKEDGCRVEESGSATQALALVAQLKPALVLLDLGLPDRDGVDFIRDLRTWSAVPVIVLSARSGELEKISALDVGADDYVSKPFSMAEVLARVRAVLRRKPSEDATAYVEFGDVCVDHVHRVVKRGGQPVHVTPIEYRLLSLMLANSGKVLTHRRLLKEVWGPASVERSHYLRIYVGHLRQKLEADPARPRHFLTETGVGYRFQT